MANIFHSSIFGILRAGQSRPIEDDDIPCTPDELRCRRTTSKLRQFWKKEQLTKKPRFFLALFRLHGARVLLYTSMVALADISAKYIYI